MDREKLLLAHHFFDFTLSRWEEYSRSGLPLEMAFREMVLPPRALRRPPPKTLGEAKERHEELRGRFQQAITYLDADYPPALAKLDAGRPPVVYLRGAPIPEENRLIGIVGTRKPSAFGVTNAEAFSQHCSARGFGIVSGLALGVDAIAHRKALPHYTLAILGSGIDTIYPKEHIGLAEDILACKGTLLSQFPPDQIPLPCNFPRRNALIAALAAGVIVVEGSEKSGAHITGKIALELGSAVVALLQDFRTPGGRGAIQLLEAGATPVRNIEEALSSIAFRFGGILSSEEIPFPGKEEFRLHDYQKEYALSLPAAIASLEAGVLSRKIERLPGGYYRRKLSPR